MINDNLFRLIVYILALYKMSTHCKHYFSRIANCTICSPKLHCKTVTKSRNCDVCKSMWYVRAWLKS